MQIEVKAPARKAFVENYQPRLPDVSLAEHLRGVTRGPVHFTAEPEGAGRAVVAVGVGHDGTNLTRYGDAETLADAKFIALVTKSFEEQFECHGYEGGKSFTISTQDVALKLYERQTGKLVGGTELKASRSCPQLAGGFVGTTNTVTPQTVARWISGQMKSAGK